MRLLLAMIIILLLSPFAVKAEQASPLQKLDEISDDALQMVKYQRYEDAKRLLNYFDEQFLKSPKNSRAFTIDELRIISVSHDEALAAAASTSMQHSERMNKLTKFRLVMDAITTKHQPLWTEMEEPIMTALGSFKDAVQRNDYSSMNMNFNSFLMIYNVIYPSMKIDIPAETIQRLDTQIDSIDGSRQVMVQAAREKELVALETDLQKIFDDMREDETDPSLWWVIISTGSIIISTLSYVGFRKYQGDKEQMKKRTREYKE